MQAFAEDPHVLLELEPLQLLHHNCPTLLILLCWFVCVAGLC
jgi:hypothetical protein